MREPIDKLYFLMLQSFRNDMGLLDDRTWIENLDTLYKAERDRTKMEMNNKYREVEKLQNMRFADLVGERKGKEK